MPAAKPIKAIRYTPPDANKASTRARTIHLYRPRGEKWDGLIRTQAVYAHVLPGNQQEAADTFARLVKEASAA